MTKPTYALRNALIVQLGFNTYKEYLSSQLWAEIRDAVFARDGGSCNLCGERAEVVHHTDYSKATMLGNNFDGLAALCHHCHHKVEVVRDGKKRTLLQARGVYYALLRKKEKKANRKRRCIRCGSTSKKKSTLCRPCLNTVKKGSPL